MEDQDLMLWICLVACTTTIGIILFIRLLIDTKRKEKMFVEEISYINAFQQKGIFPSGKKPIIRLRQTRIYLHTESSGKIRSDTIVFSIGNKDDYGIRIDNMQESKTVTPIKNVKVEKNSSHQKNVVAYDDLGVYEINQLRTE